MGRGSFDRFDFNVPRTPAISSYKLSNSDFVALAVLTKLQGSQVLRQPGVCNPTYKHKCSNDYRPDRISRLGICELGSQFSHFGRFGHQGLHSTNHFLVWVLGHKIINITCKFLGKTRAAAQACPRPRVLPLCRDAQPPPGHLQSQRVLRAGDART